MAKHRFASLLAHYNLFVNILCLSVELVRNVVFHHVNSYLVVSTLRDNKVGKTLGRLNVLQVHGAQHALVTLEHHIDSTSTLYDVAIDNTNEAFIAVGIDKYLHVEHVALCRVAQDEYTLNDDNVARLNVYGFGLAGTGEI